jgi:hypothetical protein
MWSNGPLSQVLPKHKRVPSNQHSSWPQTVKVMGAAVKLKHKSTHMEPYGGGEKSGKKAKVDARAPLVVRGINRYVCLCYTLSHCWSNVYPSFLSAGKQYLPCLRVLRCLHTVIWMKTCRQLDQQHPLYPHISTHHPTTLRPHLVSSTSTSTHTTLKQPFLIPKWPLLVLFLVL